MDINFLANIVESLLFVASGPVEIQRLAKTLETGVGEIEKAIAFLTERREQSGLRVQRNNTEVQFVTAPEAAPFVAKFLGIESTIKLSNAALETLAIIAYQQPVTRARVEAIRGVNSDYSISTLLGLGLIAEVGRLETVGHPILFGTTFDFLQHFGLDCLDELPSLEELERRNGDKSNQEPAQA